MIADEMMVNGRKDFLIVILKEQINTNKLPPELQTYLSKLFELSPKIVVFLCHLRWSLSSPT